jgi:hypothetical protein
MSVDTVSWPPDGARVLNSGGCVEGGTWANFRDHYHGSPRTSLSAALPHHASCYAAHRPLCLALDACDSRRQGHGSDARKSRLHCQVLNPARALPRTRFQQSSGRIKRFFYIRPPGPTSTALVLCYVGFVQAHPHILFCYDDIAHRSYGTAG